MDRYTATTLQNINSGFVLFELQYTTEMNLVIIAIRLL